MADEDDELETEEEEQRKPESRDIRQLREKAKRAEELEAQLAATQREAVFAKALGANIEAPWASIFQRGYDGPLEIEPIREAMKAFASPGQPQDNLDAHERVTRASAGATPAPNESDVADLVRAWNEGRIQRPEDVLAHAEQRGYPTSRTRQ